MRLREYYAAVQTTMPKKDPTIWAAVYMLDYRREDVYDFGYKDMDETMGPNIDRCPKSILDRLTTTDSEYANSWRKRCWARINRRQRQPRLVQGLVIQLDHPLTFMDNVTLERLVVSSVKPLRFIRQDGQRGIYKIPRQRLSDIGYKLAVEPEA